MDILDLEADEVTDQTYLVRELEAESIDLLEIAVSLGAAFGIRVQDDVIFLRAMRQILTDAAEGSQARQTALKDHYPHLSQDRIIEMLEDLTTGPVLQVRDLLSYIQFYQGA